MIRPDYRGRDARRAILTTLRMRERAGLRTSLSDLADTLAMARQTVYHHVRTLRDAGLVTAKRGRYGGLSLTDAGRIAAES